MNTPVEKKKVPGIVLIRDTFIDIYIPSFSKKIFTLQLSNAVYINMEIIDTDEFGRQLGDFFAMNALPPLEVCMVIQSPILKKEFTLLPQASLDLAIQTYLDYVPFDTVLSKRVKSEKGVLLIAANGDFIDTVKRWLIQLGCIVSCIIPLEGLAFVPQGGVASLTEELAQAMLKNMNQIKQESFQVTVQKEIDEFEVVEIPDKPMQPASQLPLLLGVFGILFFVLVAVYINMGKDFGLTPRPVRRKTIVPTLIPTPSATVKGISTHAYPTIVISTSPLHLGLGEKIAEMIVNEGYSDVRINSSLGESNPQTALVLPKRLVPPLREMVIQDIRSLIPNVIIRTGSIKQSSILLILGN